MIVNNLKYKFEKYISKVKKLEYVSDNDKLILYKYYKQSIEGDNTKEEPSFFNLIEKEKWKAWNSIRGMSKEEAMNNYIYKVKLLYKDNKIII